MLDKIWRCRRLGLDGYVHTFGGHQIEKAGVRVSWVLLAIEAGRAGGVLDVGGVKDNFKDSAMFSNFFSKAASSRSPKVLRSRPVGSGTDA